MGRRNGTAAHAKPRYRTVQEWLEANPLRQWRLAQQPSVTRNQLAVTLDVSRMNVSIWERGLFLPSTDHILRLETMLRIAPASWLAWRLAKPSS